MEWKYVKMLDSIDLIDEYESVTGYKASRSFRNCVIVNNGGRPSKKAFDTDKAKERTLKSFLSFNKNDRETVWKIIDWCKEDLAGKYAPFGIDNFGNLICFDINNDNVIFLNHEDATVEVIADNFDDFMEKLYD